MAAFYEGLHQRVGGRGRFHFTVGPIAYITTKSVAEFCIQYIGYLLLLFSFIRENRVLNKENQLL
ncbi:hypothetical protein TYRP_005390 [Tyrophagus putrescentiae]|nr:hypothetical protein TYRP_005390 [Tyrophagus putrescentiae]